MKVVLVMLRDIFVPSGRIKMESQIGRLEQGRIRRNPFSQLSRVFVTLQKIDHIVSLPSMARFFTHGPLKCFISCEQRFLKYSILFLFT